MRNVQPGACLEVSTLFETQSGFDWLPLLLGTVWHGSIRRVRWLAELLAFCTGIRLTSSGTVVGAKESVWPGRFRPNVIRLSVELAGSRNGLKSPSASVVKAYRPWTFVCASSRGQCLASSLCVRLERHYGDRANQLDRAARVFG